MGRLAFGTGLQGLWWPGPLIATPPAPAITETIIGSVQFSFDPKLPPTGRDQFVTLAGSGILVSFVLFVTLLCLEWFLRRYWGLV